MPNGRIQPEFITRLREVGDWLAKNGESVYGTRGGPVAPHPWGVTTKKADRLFVHVLDSQDTALLLPLGDNIRSARFLASGGSAEFIRLDSGVVLKIPRAAIDPLDTTAELRMRS